MCPPGQPRNSQTPVRLALKSFSVLCLCQIQVVATRLRLSLNKHDFFKFYIQIYQPNI